MPAPAGQFEEWQIALHGRRVIYRIAGSGPPVVLIHGMLNSSSHWQSVALELAREHTVIAPDLIGHGDSAAPRGDYSLGAHAASIRDLLAAIGIERASIVGHSLGGGVAMQFFYQFPQRVERLVLISSGGLGHEVSPMLRTAALPGVSALLSLTIQPRLLSRAGRRRPADARASARRRRVPAGARACAAPARERRRAAGVPDHAALGDRRARPARQRHRPPVPAGDDADDDRLGRARQHDPARPRPQGPRGDPAQLLQDAARRRALPAPGRSRTGWRGCCASSSRRRGLGASRTPTGAPCSRDARRARACSETPPKPSDPSGFARPTRAGAISASARPDAAAERARSSQARQQRVRRTRGSNWVPAWRLELLARVRHRPRRRDTGACS